MNPNKTLLIIYPHWHPVNLAGVHRPRLIGNYLHVSNWKVRVLTVEAVYFEEPQDPDFHQVFSEKMMVTRVSARRIRKPRIIGDIGLRSFNSLRKQALVILESEKIDFIWIPIPSFYMALVGRILHRKSGVPYGIDYIDPWIRDLTNQRSIRALASQWVARVLEPLALRKASLITGVDEKYYMPAIHRNKLLNRAPNPIVHSAFPYGFDPNDHLINSNHIICPWDENQGRIWLYSGAFLPNSHYFLDAFFQAFSEIKRKDESLIGFLQLWFIGTGPYPAKRITAYALDHGIAEQVFEVRERFPYLQTLNLQLKADAIMILGSTEKHYTASKTYQSLLSTRPIFSILHEESQALQVLESCNATSFSVPYHEFLSKEELVNGIKKSLSDLLANPSWNPDLSKLDRYSAKESAHQLAKAMERVLEYEMTKHNNQ